MKKYTQIQIENWDEAVAKYNAIMEDNSKIRVSAMSVEDRQRFSDIHNVASSDYEDVFNYMVRWGGFRGLVNTGFDSDLFDRLLDGCEPLQFPPPRYFGHPWYDLFDYADSYFECKLAHSGASKRHRDKNKGISLFLINDCPWSCPGGNPGAKQLFDINQRWINGGDNEHLWVEFLAVVTQTEVIFNTTFGRWPDQFQLLLLTRQTILTEQAPSNILTSENLFSAIGLHQDAQWLLKNTRQPNA